MPDKDRFDAVIECVNSHDVQCKGEALAMSFDPRHTAQFGESATAIECDLTQTADQYKQPHGVAVIGTIDLMGGKAGANCGNGEASPTLTHGRGSASDVHAVVSQGIAFDAKAGFPVIEESSQTIKNGTCPGHQNGVVVSRGVDDR